MLSCPWGLGRTTCASLGGLVTNATRLRLALPMIMYALLEAPITSIPIPFRDQSEDRTIFFQDICQFIYSCHTRKGVLWSIQNPL